MKFTYSAKKSACDLAGKLAGRSPIGLDRLRELDFTQIKTFGAKLEIHRSAAR